MIAKCCSKLIYKTLAEEEVVYVLPITSMLGVVPVDLARDTETIQSRYHDCCHIGVIATPTTLQKPAGEGCPKYFVNSWALGSSSDPRD